MNPALHFIRWSGSLALLAALSACGGSGGAGPASQVVAKVNGEEISVHQLNFFMSRIPNVSAERAGEVRKQVVERLIEQEILVQQALAQKLDRDPAVMQQLEASRRELLSRAMLDKIATQTGRPEADEVGKFFASNPALFAERRVFRFNEVVLPGVPPSWDALQKSLASAQTFAQAVGVLKAAGIEPPVASGVQRASEHLPINILPALNKGKNGTVFVYANPPRVVIAELVESRPAPVDESSAGPVIERFLLNQKRRETVRSEVKRLREIAQIAYVGDFGPAGGATQQAAPSAPEASEAAAQAPKAADADDEALRKGVAGLK